jgi:pimeloyl-ACP methyl ester carboxylesterase
MHTVSPRVLCFEAYCLDLQQCALLRGDEAVQLRPKSFDVLRHLAEHAGRLVSKEELMQAVWAGLSVTDDSLVQCIKDIREAVGDNEHRIIKTLPRRGYLFAAKISGAAQGGAASAPPAQAVTFCRTSDGVNIAIGCAGKGLPLVRTSSWFNHLEYEWQNPLRAPLLHFLASRYRLIRYDGRGNGLSDLDVPDISFAGFQRDLEAVVDALQLDRYAIMGMSQGAAIAIDHAVRYPERVTKLVLHGGLVVGRKRRNLPRDDEIADALLALAHHGWGEEHSAFLRAFSSQYIPNGSAAQLKWLADLQRMATTRDNAVRMLKVWFDIDISELLPKVVTPTLVLHGRCDSAVPFDQGRQMASRIPNAKFVILDSENHIPVEEEPAWPKFLREIEAFLAE